MNQVHTVDPDRYHFVQKPGYVLLKVKGQAYKLDWKIGFWDYITVCTVDKTTLFVLAVDVETVLAVGQLFKPGQESETIHVSLYEQFGSRWKETHNIGLAKRLLALMDQS